MAVIHELVVIYDPFLTDEDYNQEVEKLRDAIAKRGAQVTNVEVWGKKRLAYAIDKKAEGYYVVVTIEGQLSGEAVAEIERSIRLNERSLRHMITRVPVLKPRKEKVKKPRNEENRNVSRENYSAGSAGASDRS